jgi:hypothetical protein
MRSAHYYVSVLIDVRIFLFPAPVRSRVLATRRYLTGTPTSALLQFFRGQNPAAFIRVTPRLPTDAGEIK